MKNTYILIIFVQLFIGCSAPKTISLTSNPSGAGVWTNTGRYIGDTPCVYKEKKMPEYYLFKEWGYDYKKIATSHNVTSYYAVLDKETNKTSSSTHSTQSKSYVRDAYNKSNDNGAKISNEYDSENSHIKSPNKIKSQKLKYKNGNKSTKIIPKLKKTKVNN